MSAAVPTFLPSRPRLLTDTEIDRLLDYSRRPFFSHHRTSARSGSEFEKGHKLLFAIPVRGSSFSAKQTSPIYINVGAETRSPACIQASLQLIR